MVSLLIFFIIYSILFKLFFLTSKLFWYIIISKLIHSYWNFYMVLTLSSFFFRINLSLFSSVLLFINFFFDNFFIFTWSLIPHKLLSGYNNVHPIFFYLSLILLLGFYGLWKKGFFVSLKTVFFTALVALVLGGLWGSGNSIWGFFWVNDSIELILLFLLCIIVTLLHIENSRSSNLNFYIVFFIIVVWLILLRWGFSFTRHNFFDLKKLVNTSLYFFIFLVNKFNLVCIFLILFFLVILPFLVYLFSRKIFTFQVFSNCTRLIHLIIFVLSLGWIYFKQNNLLLFNLENIFFYFNESLKFSPITWYNSLNFIKFKFYNINLHQHSLLFYYNIKLFSMFKVIMSYSFFWLFIYLYWFI